MDPNIVTRAIKRGSQENESRRRHMMEVEVRMIERRNHRLN